MAFFGVELKFEDSKDINLVISHSGEGKFLKPKSTRSDIILRKKLSK